MDLENKWKEMPREFEGPNQARASGIQGVNEGMARGERDEVEGQMKSGLMSIT